MENLNNSKLARWQGWKEGYGIKVVSPNGLVFTSLPDYLNDDAAAMSLLDTLVEKGYWFTLDAGSEKYKFCFKAGNFDINGFVVDSKSNTINATIVTAVLELIEKESIV